MSPTTATAAALPKPALPKPALPKTQPRRSPPLRLVPQRRSSAAKAPFVIVVIAALFGGLLALLLLNTLVAQGSFALHDLGKQQRALDVQEQALASRVAAEQAPAVLAARATALGMVPGGAPAFLQLPSGKVLGLPTAGAAPVVPLQPVTTTPKTADNQATPKKTTATQAKTTKTTKTTPGTTKVTPPKKAPKP